MTAMTSTTAFAKGQFAETPEFRQSLDRLAEVAIRAGLGLAPGQELVMTATLDEVNRVKEHVAYSVGAAVLMAGGDLYVLMSILGHKTIAMTQCYAHLSPAYKKAMVERMEQIWVKLAVQPAVKPAIENPRRLIQRHGRVTDNAVAASA